MVMFWRPNGGPMAHRRHPLICPRLGIGLETFRIDLMHTVHLGMLQDWVLCALWAMVDADVFD
eukprot:5224401-Pyramimonas_sp.AAC.1